MNKKAESLVWIVIWVFILSFVILWVVAVSNYSKTIISNFNRKTNLDLLTTDAYNIVWKLDTSSLIDWDVFYIYKNKATHKFEIKTDSQYEYVDNNYIKINNFDWREYFFEQSFIKKDNFIIWNISLTWSIVNKKSNKFYIFK